MNKQRVSNEPIWWIPFSGGGMVAALFVPIHIVIFGIGIPLGLITDPGQAALLELAQLPLTKLYLCVFVGGGLFHWAHRFRHVIKDLGIHAFPTPIAIACYGSAFGGTVWACTVFFGA